MALQRWVQSFLANKLSWNVCTCSNALNQLPVASDSTSKSFLDSLKEDGILWNTPKKRKSVNMIYRKRYGATVGRHQENGGASRRYNWGDTPLIFDNKKIRVDHRTMEYFELNRLAPKTYEKVMAETKEIRDKVRDAFGQFAPRDKDVRVMYQGEKYTFGMSADDNRMPVEMEKERPTFFTKNLMQKAKTPSGSASNTTVRPSGLS